MVALGEVVAVAGIVLLGVEYLAVGIGILFVLKLLLLLLLGGLNLKVTNIVFSLCLCLRVGLKLLRRFAGILQVQIFV